MFHFKKFSIDDSLAAMKTGTDSVMLGAWTPVDNPAYALDIGTGPGLLALMLAQRTQQTLIDAVEIEPAAAALARQNFELSPWSRRIKIIGMPFQEFAATTSQKYDLVISNPPFFSHSLQTPRQDRTLARHDSSLPAPELFHFTAKVLNDSGAASFIFPAGSFGTRKHEAALAGLFPSKIAMVKSYSGSVAHRAMVVFTKIRVLHPAEDEIVIYDSPSHYSQAYRSLTRDFYLRF